MEEIKNVIVKQTDIYDIIKSFNEYFTTQQKIFDETERLVKEEEEKYNEWHKARFSSDDYANFPEFKRQTFKNKVMTASLTIDTTYIDGSSVTGKSSNEFIQSVAHLGFDKMEAITINMNISYMAEYKADDYSSNPGNRISQDVYIKFKEDSIYYSVSGENCSATVTDLKNIILNKFDSLEPRLSKLITNRKKIKYRATLHLSMILSAVLICALMYVAKQYVTFVDLSPYKLAFIPAYLIVAFLINTMIPSAKLSRLYSLIIPKQIKEYSSYDKAYHNTDNVKDFVSYPEVQIGKSAKKAGVRETIKKHIKKSKIKNVIAFILTLSAVIAATMIIF